MSTMKMIMASIVSIAVTFAACAQDQVVNSAKGPAIIHDSLQKIVNEENIPGMVAAIIDSSGVIAMGSSGVRNINVDSPLEVGDKIHIGSCTKAMTSVMLATLVADDVLSWETTLIEVFPGLKDSIHPDYHGITLWQLLTHRAGVPENAGDWWAYNDANIKERRRSILKANLKTPSNLERGEFLYSNLGYMIAGCMAEKLTGLTWEALMEKRLFKPLRMTAAGFGPVTGRHQPSGHKKSNGKWQPTDEGNAEALGPAGRVHCTVEDWAKFLTLFLPGNNTLNLHNEHLGQLTTPEGDYSGGWIVTERSWAKGKTLSHSGSNTTWFATVWIAPSLNRGFIVATNSCDKNSGKLCGQAIGKLIAIDKNLPENTKE